MRPSRRLLPLLLLASAACAARGAAGPGSAAAVAAPFQVVILGDMPYAMPAEPGYAAGQAAYRALLDTVAARPAAFVVHIGDFTRIPCSDSLFALRLQEFRRMSHPLVYTPGDNEWSDCARDGRDPMERLARLRELFHAGGTSLGQRPIALERQSEVPGFATYRENARWVRGGVLFVTLHVIGPNDNRGRDSTPGTEWVARNAANMAWLRDAFARAERDGLRGVAIFMQANPLVDGMRAPAGPRPLDGFAELRGELRRLAAGFGRPVALVHGDSHTFRVDKPFRDVRTGRVLANLTRAETFGHPDFHALLMTVEPGSANLFRFEPLLLPAAGDPR